MNDKNKSTTGTARVLKLGDGHRQAEAFAPGSLTLDALQGFIASVATLEKSVATLEKPAQAAAEGARPADSEQPAARVSSLNALLPKPDDGSGTSLRTGLSLATPSGERTVAPSLNAQVQSFPGPARPKPRKD